MKTINLSLTEAQEKTLMTNLEERLSSFNHLLLSAEALQGMDRDNSQIGRENIEYFAKRIQDLEELLTVIKKAT